MHLLAGNREAAQELTGRGKEHAHLAKEARQRANQAAYDSCNMSVTNRFKVRSCCTWHKAHDDHSSIAVSLCCLSTRHAEA